MVFEKHWIWECRCVTTLAIYRVTDISCYNNSWDVFLWHYFQPESIRFQRILIVNKILIRNFSLLNVPNHIPILHLFKSDTCTIIPNNNNSNRSKLALSYYDNNYTLWCENRLYKITCIRPMLRTLLQLSDIDACIIFITSVN